MRFRACFALMMTSLGLVMTQQSKENGTRGALDRYSFRRHSPKHMKSDDAKALFVEKERFGIF